MNVSRRSRVERVLAGVVRQAVQDAAAPFLAVTGTGGDARFARQICELAVGPERFGAGGLLVDPANKTALLLGGAPAADVLLFGDLYYSQVAELAGSAGLPAPIARLAEACGGADVLDQALLQFFDLRRSWREATAALAPGARDQLEAALEHARFRRSRLGLVPKLGARTLGIDLFA